MIYISDAAQTHFSNLLSNKEKGTQIRAFVNKPGTSEAEIGLSYCSPDEVKNTDVAWKFKKLTIYIDKLSAPYLKDMEIDFVVEQFSSQLLLKAPNAKIKKVNKNATLVDRVEYFLQSQINPQLASHNGLVTLIEITSDGYAVLQFSGACNGCSMVSSTLKEGIEKHLLNEFSELKGVRDFTLHRHGEHSYC